MDSSKLTQAGLGALCWVAAVLAITFAPKEQGLQAFSVLSQLGTAMIMNALPALTDIAKPKRSGQSDPPPPSQK